MTDLTHRSVSRTPSPPGSDDYDAADDFENSLNDCYRAVRERVAAGGEPWRPNEGTEREGHADRRQGIQASWPLRYVL